MKIYAFLLAATSFAVAPLAQTTGVPGYNDLTVNGLGSATTSCTDLSVPPGLVTFNVSTAPNVPTVFLFTVFCDCYPCFFARPPSEATCPIPYTACAGTTNQSIDLLLGYCPVLSATVISDAAGDATLTLLVPPGFSVGVQAASVHPCQATSPFPILLTQAFTVVT